MPLVTARAIDVANKIVNEINSMSTGLTFTAVRRWSFGFTDGELSSLQVVVRPYDMDRSEEARGDEEHFYEIQVGVYKKVARRNTAEIDDCYNLAINIAAEFPLNRVISVGAGDVEVVENRFMPMFVRTDRIMDNYDSSDTRFMSHLLLKFREYVDE